MESDDAGCPVGAEVGFAVFAFVRHSKSGVERAEGEEFSRCRANGDAGFLENHGVDWREKGRAADAVFELVLTILGEAAELAFANLGLGSPRGYRGVAPGSQNTGCNRWGSGFS